MQWPEPTEMPPDDEANGADHTDAAADSDQADGDARPSRTQRTAEAAAVNRLGIEMTKLSPGDLDRLDLPTRLHEEIVRCQRLNARSRGRQNRLIGQLLRAEDHEAIRARVESLRMDRRAGVQQEKMNDQWRDRLIEEGDAGVEALIEKHPEADRQQLRRLTRTARGSEETKARRRARRELLRAIRRLRAV